MSKKQQQFATRLPAEKPAGLYRLLRIWQGDAEVVALLEKELKRRQLPLEELNP